MMFHQQQSQSHRFGNDLCFLYSCDLLDILIMFYMETLNFTIYQQLGFIMNCLVFNFSSLCCCLNIFRNPIFIFCLDKNYRCWSSSSLSLNLFCLRVHPCIHEEPLSLFPIPLLGFDFSTDGWSTSGCLVTVSPRLKGRTNVFLFFLLNYFVALIRNRYGVRYYSSS